MEVFPSFYRCVGGGLFSSFLYLQSVTLSFSSLCPHSHSVSLSSLFLLSLLSALFPSLCFAPSLNSFLLSSHLLFHLFSFSVFLSSHPHFCLSILFSYRHFQLSFFFCPFILPSFLSSHFSLRLLYFSQVLFISFILSLFSYLLSFLLFPIIISFSSFSLLPLLPDTLFLFFYFFGRSLSPLLTSCFLPSCLIFLCFPVLHSPNLLSFLPSL